MRISEGIGMTVTVSGERDYTLGEPERETGNQRGHKELKRSDWVEKVGTGLKCVYFRSW